MEPEQFQEVEPEVAEAVACAEGVVNVEQSKDLDPQVAGLKDAVAVACAPGVVDAERCQELEPEAEVTEIVTNDVYLTIEDCSGGFQHPLVAANGDGDGAADANGRNVSHAEMTPPAEEMITELGLMSSSPPDSLLAAEPSWGDVPDEPVVPALVTPRFPKRPRPAPENVEVDDVVQTMRNILMDLRNLDDARLNADDEAKVRSLLEYHPQAEEKKGSGIDYIKIKRHSTFKDSRCFWVVRTDGSETDFSYHKCLKEKVAKDHPTFADRYDAVYRAPRRPRQA